jgi:uncharacterized protein YndB with AHSA1/START domain
VVGAKVWGMGTPTTASRTIEIDASAEAVYDLLSDVTRTGEWSPECRSCRWLDAPGRVGSRFRGRNRTGPLVWSTTAEVVAAERPRAFEFATLAGSRPATRWRDELEGDGPVRLTESFDSVYAPPIIGLVERVVMPRRQQALERGLTATLERIMAIAEAC